MKTKLIIAAVPIALLAFLAGRFLAPSSHAPGSASQPEASQASDASPQKWTCSMHPQIQTSSPGDCPICGMDLIPLKEAGDKEDAGPREMSMSEAARALADIQTTAVTRRFPEKNVRLVGKLAYDETRMKALTARFPARIDELFVNYTGISVEKGEHLARVYSPELLSAQRELLTAHQRDPDGSITLAAREKLRLWDLLPEQIDAIVERGEARTHFTLRAPIGGVVIRKNVKEGSYVETGDPLFKISDLEHLWLYLDAYESDLPWLRYGQDVSFTVQARPGETFHGRIAFIEPEVDSRTRTVQVRVNVPNAELDLKPGMFARGEVHVRMARDGAVSAPEFAGKWISPMHPEIVKDHPGQCDTCGMDLVPAEELGYAEPELDEAPLVVPASAVLRTGKRSVVYVEQPDADRPTFEGREIRIGPRAGDVFVVKSGLREGERVVTNGAFKIDSALQIEAKPSMMNPERGANNGAQGSGPGAKDEDPGLSAEMASEVLPAYFEVHDALAGDDLEAAKAALKDMMRITGHGGALPELIHTMLDAESLETIRKPHFEKLSNALVEAVRSAPDSVAPDDSNLYLMHCPMVYGDRGADWLQNNDSLRNPYFGAAMLKCGQVKEKLTE